MGFARLSVRGVQSNANDEGGDQAMTFNIDGDYINRGNFINAAMFDLERVEVLRGPQGTLYGRNATAGAVNVIARKPSLKGLDVTVSADFGDYSSQIYNGALNVAFGEHVAIRLAAMYNNHDGYTDHPNFDEATNSEDSQAYRLGVLFKFTGRLVTLPRWRVCRGETRPVVRRGKRQLPAVHCRCAGARDLLIARLDDSCDVHARLWLCPVRNALHRHH